VNKQPSRRGAAPADKSGSQVKRWTEATARAPDDFEEEAEPARLPAESRNIARGEDPAASVQRPKSGAPED
jgi:hypothetical protein